MTKKEITKKKILDAAIAEYGTKGYTLASTNTIFKAANVSKGTVFLYFGSKADLFYEAFVYSAKMVIEAIADLDLSQYRDVFEKMVEISMFKLKYFSTRPHESAILLEGFSNPPPSVAPKIVAQLDLLSGLSLNRFFDEIDMNQFSDEYTKEDVILYIQMAFNSIQSNMDKKQMSLDYLASIKEDTMKYLQIVLKGMKK